MNEQQFEDWVNTVHCDLFHVLKTDLDDKHGVRCDQLIVINNINENPGVLRHKTLKELLDMFDVF
jgi:hypothetical protein